MDKYVSPKAAVVSAGHTDYIPRPLWLTLSIILFGLLIFPLFLSAVLVLYVEGGNDPGRYGFLFITLFSSVGLIGIWRMKMWGVASLVLGYFVYAAFYTYGGGDILGFPQAIFPVIYLLLYFYLKQEFKRAKQQ
ncbi:MAG: hypothetical protein R3208_16610 [Ketobacteraceae bacterium]|nr:hypothetical protein [Ketobacteraceae bacterium]